jgi:hypothetical protein
MFEKHVKILHLFSFERTLVSIFKVNSTFHGAMIFIFILFFIIVISFFLQFSYPWLAHLLLLGTVLSNFILFFFHFPDIAFLILSCEGV